MGIGESGAGGRVEFGSGGVVVNINWDGAGLKLLGDAMVADGGVSVIRGGGVEPSGMNEEVGL